MKTDIHKYKINPSNLEVTAGTVLHYFADKKFNKDAQLSIILSSLASLMSMQNQTKIEHNFIDFKIIAELLCEGEFIAPEDPDLLNECITIFELISKTISDNNLEENTAIIEVTLMNSLLYMMDIHSTPEIELKCDDHVLKVTISTNVKLH